MEQHFIVTTSRIWFNLSIKTTDFQHFVYLGGKKKGCVQIIVNRNDHNDERLMSFMDPCIAALDRVDYNSTCNIIGDMQPGEGTRQRTLERNQEIRALGYTVVPAHDHGW